MARATTSRGASSAPAMPAITRFPAASIRIAPSPRRASVASGRGPSVRVAIAVGWNCTNSTSRRTAPARAARARPEPTAPAGFVVVR